MRAPEHSRPHPRVMNPASIPALYEVNRRWVGRGTALVLAVGLCYDHWRRLHQMYDATIENGNGIGIGGWVWYWWLGLVLVVGFGIG